MLTGAINAPNDGAHDIVATATNAIVAQDADTLNAMRFDAYGPDNAKLTVDGLLARINQCKLQKQVQRNAAARAREIHYLCDNVSDEQRECESNILTVLIDRATSPDVTAILRYKRRETEECALPPVPSPPVTF